MERRAAGRTARQDEMPERRQASFQSIDELFKAHDILVAKLSFSGSVGDSATGIRQLRAQRKQVALQPDELGVEFRVWGACTRQAEMRVQLVDLAVRTHSWIGLPNPRAAEERRLARVSRPGVDLHGEEA